MESLSIPESVYPHFRQNSQIEIHFKVVKAHAQTYYNNYVDQLTREVIYKEKADNHLCYQLMNDDQFLRDFLNNHPYKLIF